MNIHHEKIDGEITVAKKVYRVVEGDHLLHWHRNIEYLYIADGTLILEVSGECFVCNAGDVAVIQCGELHKFVRTVGECTIYLCTFRPELSDFWGREIRYIRSHIRAEDLENAMPDEDVSKIFREIYEEYEKNLPMFKNIIRSDIQRLYALFARHFERKDGMGIRSFRGLEDFQTALTFISENYKEKITLKDVASKINYNPSYVSTLFVNYTGVNFKVYLDTIRIEQAIGLIKNTTKTVAYIATECGFDNLKTFNNTFRRVTGISPGKFREENR